MKEQWGISENNIDPTIVEEGLYQKKQKCVKKTNCCVRCIPYLRLIFLLEVTLFFGWGCYMILQTYLPQVNETTSGTFEGRYHLPIEYETEIQQLRPSTEIPATFEVIDKIHNILKDMIKTENLTQEKAIVTDGVSMALTNTQNSNNVQNNYTGGLSVINKLLTLYESLLHEKFTISPVSEKSSIESTDENVSTYEKNQSLRHVQFLEKLRNISKAANDLEKSENKSDFGEDVDRSTLKSQENHSLDASNKFKSLEFNAASISNRKNFPEDPMTSVDSTNTLSELRQKFATQEHGDLVICPPSESHESSDTSMNDSDKGPFTSTSTSQGVLAQEISKQVENKSSDDVDERNKDKHDVNDSDTSTATVRDTEKQYSSESIAKIIGDEKSMEITENPYKLWSVPQPTVQDSVEFLTPNVDKFEWFSGSPSSVDFERSEWKDISKSSTEQNLPSENMNEIIPESQCKITIETGILEVNCPAIKFNEKWNFASSETSPTNVNFPPKVPNFRDIHYILNSMCGEDASEQLENENISNENSDKGVTTPRDSVPKIINRIDLQESTTSAKISNDALPDLFDAPFIDSYEMDDEYEDYDYRYKRDTSENLSEFYLNYFEDKDESEQVMPNSFSKFMVQIIDLKKAQHPLLDMIKQQQEQLKINEEQDSVFKNTEFLKAYDDLNKKLISLLKDEMLNVTTRYLLKWTTSDFNKWNICSILPYIRFTHQTHTWREHFLALKKLWEDNKKIDVGMYPNYSHSMEDNHRKKRMIDDLNRQPDQISNTLEEDDKDKDLLIEKLKEIFMKMEILALCIDRLRYSS
ncbi:PREDICTED: uncharacterized protein LOC105449896 [Wasmannia auropunctata]|uniref:uncharacterized protein LOC105449896 n=1 Tax=Wasmannia auropunctata TaxID=64793 RepID=UPI0005EE8A3B|nr:PREDICTED: uncharacterized protein LOC105449896 [Wasmannia auropunctata]